MNDCKASVTLQEYLCDCFFFFFFLKRVSGHFSKMISLSGNQPSL